MMTHEDLSNTFDTQIILSDYGIRVDIMASQIESNVTIFH